jgi:O-antigen/teichoic acid export membrane protein
MINQINFLDTKRIIKGSGITIFGTFFGRAVLYVLQIVFARLMGTETFGAYILGWTLLRIFENFSAMGLNYGVLRYGRQFYTEGDHNNLKKLISITMALGFAIGIIVSLSLFSLSDYLAFQIFNNSELINIIRGIAIAIPFASVIRIAGWALNISQNMRYSVISCIIVPNFAVLIFALFSFCVLNLGVEGVILSIILAHLVSAILASYYLGKLFFFHKPENEQRKAGFNIHELLKYSMVAALPGFFTLLLNWLDRLFIGYYLSANEVGLYQAMAQLPVFFTMAIQAMNQVFVSFIPDLYQQGNLEKINALYKTTTRLLIGFCFPILLTLLFVPRELITIIYGSEFVQDLSPFIILSFSFLLGPVVGGVMPILIMTGNEKKWLLVTFISIILSIISNVLFIPGLGILGAAIASLIGSMVMNIGGLVLVWRKFRLFPLDKTDFKFFIPAMLSIAGMVIITAYDYSNLYVQTFLTAAISVVLFWPLSYIFYKRGRFLRRGEVI